jgi:hypothetical protein
VGIVSRSDVESDLDKVEAFLSSGAPDGPARDLLWRLASCCDREARRSHLVPREREAWIRLTDRCLGALGIQRIRTRGRPKKELDPVLRRGLKYEYEMLQDELNARRAEGRLKGKDLTEIFKRTFDDWELPLALRGEIFIDVQRTRPTWRPLRRAMAQFVGISESELRRRVIDASLDEWTRRIPREELMQKLKRMAAQDPKHGRAGWTRPPE